MEKIFKIPIIMCNAEDLANMDIDWSYNASVLKLINVTKGSLNEKALFDWNEVSPGKLKIAFARSKGVTGSKNSIAIMKFNIIGNPGGHCRIFQFVDKKLHRGLPLWLPPPFGVILLRNTPGVTLAW